MPGLNSVEIGRREENRARRWLEAKGYRFRAANVRSREGEVDLVMERGDTIVFVEVKARADAAHGPPMAAVHGGKQRKIIRAALHYIKENRLQGRAFRFDVLSLTPDAAEHIEDAFQAPPGMYTI